MNKDKAIQLLERLQDPEPYEPMLTKDAYDAIQMAIDALSADGDTISRQAAISAICNACGKIDCDKMDKCEKLQLPPANCSEFPNNSDTISRQAAIDALDEIEAEVADGYGYQYAKWREYFAKMQSAPLAPDQNGDLWITVPDIDEVTCVYVQENKSKFCRIFYEEQEQTERIIYCKDCKWWTKQECSPQGRCALSGMYPTGGWFCGNVRRREVTE